MNPIRWKSQYYDTESGLYFMGGRYYSPEIRRYLSAASAESMMGNAAMIYGLNPYLLTLTNPINMCYNGNTINTNIELSYDPEALSNWELFWNKYGRFVLGTVELLAGLALCLTGYGGGLGVGLIIGGGSTLISEGLTSAGMNSRGAMQVESTLTIAAGVLLCFTAMAPLGASLIGAGACGLIGGLISERVGGNYSVGWVIGNVVGGILGSYAYQGVQAIRRVATAGAAANTEVANAATPEANKISDMSYDDMLPSEKAAYDGYSKNGWKGNYPGQAKGTRAGGNYLNSDGKLPTKSSYREFDINPPTPGIGRDASRFVVSNDKIVYLTRNHYLTFVRIIE